MKKYFKVGVVMPEDVTTTEMVNYIREAVQTWKGQLHPVEDPLFDLDRKTVSVVAIRDIYPKDYIPY